MHAAGAGSGAEAADGVFVHAGEIAAAQRATRQSSRSSVDVLDLPQLADEPPDFRILRAVRSRNYPRRFSTTYAVETESGIFALVTRLSDVSHMSRPPQDPR